MDSFIGEEFPTKKGGTLTIVGVSDRSYKGAKIYKINCSICNLDKELFPLGFECTKSGIHHGAIPCGCSSRPKWNKNQYEIRVRRLCLKRDYTFLGFVGEDSICNKTKIKLRCNVDNSTWDSTNINDLFTGKGCPVCGVFNRTTTRSDLIASFIRKGVYLEGTEFIPSKVMVKNLNDKRQYWEIICPLCSKDDYVNAGVCSGVFLTTRDKIIGGTRSCRCSTNYRWTTEQREYQVVNICKLEGLIFKGWFGNKDKITNKVKLKWTCKNDHVCSTRLSDFMSGVRCKQCHDDSGALNGYYPKRAYEEDSLYIVNFNNEYVKVGRSFDVGARLKKLYKQSKMDKAKVSLVGEYLGIHRDVYDTEQALHRYLTERGYYHHESYWTKETFTMDSVLLIPSFLQACRLEQVYLKQEVL